MRAMTLRPRTWLWMRWQMVLSRWRRRRNPAPEGVGLRGLTDAVARLNSIARSCPDYEVTDETVTMFDDDLDDLRRALKRRANPETRGAELVWTANEAVAMLRIAKHHQLRARKDEGITVTIERSASTTYTHEVTDETGKTVREVTIEHPKTVRRERL